MRFKIQRRNEMINRHADYKVMRAANRRFGPKRMLDRHSETQHNGVIDPNCNACRELQDRINKNG